MNTITIIFFIGFIFMTGVSLYIDWSWRKSCEELNDSWFEICNKKTKELNDAWLELCNGMNEDWRNAFERFKQLLEKDNTNNE